MSLPTCCEYHGKADGGCREGRDCPVRKARIEQRNGGARIEHGQIVGYESGGNIPDPPKPKGRDWGAIGMYCAVLAAVIFALAVICPTVPLR